MQHRLRRSSVPLVTCVAVVLLVAGAAEAQKPKRLTDADLPWPPTLPGGKEIVADSSPKFLEPPAEFKKGIAVAKTVPTIEFAFFPGQKYPGKPWSNWGDGSVANGKYYSAIGDHYAIGRGEAKHGTGTAGVFEYDPEKKSLRQLVDVTKLLDMPKGHYTPGKIHSRVDMGRDGWLYYSTHRGSPRAANDENHYEGDWIFRTNPESGKSEVVVHAPIPKHSIPASVLDPDRLIFYGATAAGPDAENQSIVFFAYDCASKKLLHRNDDGPARYLMLARSTGKLYYVPGAGDGSLLRFDPENPGPPQEVGVTMGIRCATAETKDGKIYTVGLGQRSEDATVWEFDVKTEKARKIGTVAVGPSAYVASIDADPSGRFLYYVPGAHGGGYKDGSPLVQFEIATGKKKVIAFLHPFYEEKYGLIPKGTYSTAISEDGGKVFVTWNVSRGVRAWDSCGLTVIHVPEEER